MMRHRKFGGGHTYLGESLIAAGVLTLIGLLFVVHPCVLLQGGVLCEGLIAEIAIPPVVKGIRN